MAGKTKFPKKRLKAIELLAAGGKHNEVAAECGIACKTLYLWKRDPDFVDAVVNRARELMKSELSSVYNKLTQKATEGSHQHIKILLDHLDRLEEMRTQAASNTVTFVWQTPDANND